MSSDHGRQLDAANAEIDTAQCALVEALESAYDDDTALDHIKTALNRLRLAQARRTAIQSGLVHLPDLVGWG